MLATILSVHRKPYANTETLMQDARLVAWVELFGKAEENVQYTNFIKLALEQAGHHAQLHFTGRQQCLKIYKILISNKIIWGNNLDNTTIKPQDQRQFIKEKNHLHAFSKICL
jgi:hypothetical protein